MSLGLLGYFLNQHNNNKATNAINDATQQGIDTIGGYYNDAKGYLDPYMQSGLAGNSRLMALLNDPNSIKNTEAYKWRLGQGQNALDMSAASRGGLFSGAHQKDTMEFGQGLASQEYGNEWNRLMGLTGMGQQSATDLGVLGMGAGRSIAELQGDMGANRASNYTARGSNQNDFLGGLGSLFSLFGG